MKTKLISSIVMALIFVAEISAQQKIYTKFPILADNEKMHWKEYDKAKNVKVEDNNSFSFDLTGDHYKVKAYPNGVKTIKISASERTGNKSDKDSVTDTKIFLLPSDYMEQKVIVVQISYMYEEKSLRLKGFSMIPLRFFNNIQDARKEYKLAGS